MEVHIFFLCSTILQYLISYHSILENGSIHILSILQYSNVRTLAIPALQDPSDKAGATKIRPYAHQLRGRQYRQMTTSPNQTMMQLARSPCPALRIPAVRAPRNPPIWPGQRKLACKPISAFGDIGKAPVESDVETPKHLDQENPVQHRA